MNKTLAGVAILLGLIGTVHATAIEYSAESIAGTDWRYSYSLTNNTLGVGIEEFTIYFDRTLYSNLAVVASPTGWDSLVVQPDNSIPSDGFFDSIHMLGGISPGTSSTGFSVVFSYYGTGIPGPQRFEIVDASFNVLDSGLTALSAPIPEPSSYLLLVVGLAVISLARRRVTSKSTATRNLRGSV